MLFGDERSVIATSRQMIGDVSNFEQEVISLEQKVRQSFLRVIWNQSSGIK